MRSNGRRVDGVIERPAAHDFRAGTRDLHELPVLVAAACELRLELRDAPPQDLHLAIFLRENSPRQGRSFGVIRLGASERLCANQPVSRVQCYQVEPRETHTATPSSWRRVDGVETMIEPWETRRHNLIYALCRASATARSRAGAAAVMAALLMAQEASK